MKNQILISIAYNEDDFLQNVKSARIKIYIYDTVTHQDILNKYSNKLIENIESFEKQVVKDVKKYIKEKQINLWYKDALKLPIKIEYLGI